MSEHFRISSLVRPKLEEIGLSPVAVLRHANLPLNLLDETKVFVTTERLFAFYNAIAELSPDPAVGLKLGSEERIERYDPIAIASLYTHSFRDALARASRYKRLVCPETISVIDQDYTSFVRFDWLLADGRGEPPVLIDHCFAWLFGIGRRGTGQPITPIRVEFKRKPSHREIFTEHFGCPVRFNADANAMVFKKSDLDRPFLTYNADLLAMIAPQLESELAFQQAQQTTRDQVKTTLKRLLAGQRPDIKEVARELGQSVRTLQRRLAESGATFQELLEDARRELAQHYLLHSSLELNETAYLLGYETASSFFRAFTQWEGVPPGRWREKMVTPPL
ncbi:MAG: AraC family transcriptional regulator [Chthoniobacteraceae bacterium]